MNDTIYRMMNNASVDLPEAKPLSEQETMNIMKRFRAENGIHSDVRSETVSGVEHYRRPKWYRTAMTAAACLTLVSGIAFGGVLIFNSTKHTVPMTETETTNTDISETTETQKQFRELQLHELYTVDTIEEADALAESHMTEYSLDDRYGVDTDHYAEQLKNADDLNTCENKSYIYHMMLNSLNYYDTLQGSYNDSGCQTEFRLNLNDRSYYLKVTNDVFGTETVTETYFKDNIMYRFYHENGNSTWYEKKVYDKPETEYMIPEDNYRKIYVESGVPADGRYSHEAENSIGLYCLSSISEYSGLKCLYDFEQWNIEKLEEYNGRECAVIKGMTNHPELDYDNGRIEEYDGQDVAIVGGMDAHQSHDYDCGFTMYVDIYTGIEMKFSYDSDRIEGYSNDVSEIEVDAPCDITLPDLSRYQQKQYVVTKGNANLMPVDEIYYPLNSRGQSYGEISDAQNAVYQFDENEPPKHYLPDLIKVTGDNGKEGYILTGKCVYIKGYGFRNNPLNEEEWAMRAYCDDGNEDCVIPVYEADGVTEIDTFTLIKKQQSDVFDAQSGGRIISAS